MIPGVIAVAVVAVLIVSLAQRRRRGVRWSGPVTPREFPSQQQSSRRRSWRRRASRRPAAAGRRLRRRSGPGWPRNRMLPMTSISAATVPRPIPRSRRRPGRAAGPRVPARLNEQSPLRAGRHLVAGGLRYGRAMRTR